MNRPNAIAGRRECREFTLSIGSVPLQLQFQHEDLQSPLQNRYGAFQCAAGGARPIAMERKLRERAKDAEFQYDFEGTSLRALRDEIRFEGVRTEYCVDAMLRIYLSWALLELDGFLLHAASVVRNGRAFVFTGRSGAGKSTLASLAPEGSVLTDEISLIRKEKGEWRAYGTPFWGEFRAAGQNVNAPVAGVFRLLQSPENNVSPLRPPELLRAMLPNVLFFSAESRHSAKLLEILTAAVREIPGHCLGFKKDTSFWEVLPQ